MKKQTKIYKIAAEFICGVDSIVYTKKSAIKEGNYKMVRDFIYENGDFHPNALNLVYYKDHLICRSISDTCNEIAEIIEDKDNHEEMLWYIRNAINKNDILELLNIDFDYSCNSYAISAKSEIEKIARKITEEYYHDLLS